MKNVNTKSYWDKRFSEDWELKNGRRQTANFAKSQIKYIDLDENFSGTILDFGCGLGDAMPTYKARFPKAELIGVDISTEAIRKCSQKYGGIASFYSGVAADIKNVDVIISSNVFEHLTDDKAIAKELMLKCKSLYIIVPYKENPLSKEHVNSYDENSFNDLNPKGYKIFKSKGWTQYGMRLVALIIKNFIRLACGKKIESRAKQIIFIF